MRTELQILYRAIQQFLIYSLAAALTIGMLFMDAIFMGSKLQEFSFVEITQEIMLLLIVILFLKLAYQKPDIRNSSVLIAGFFACMFIRELDSIFDLIIHGFWIYPAMAIAVTGLIYAALNIKNTLIQLANFTRSPNYGFMISGLICILVFSRLFGMKYLWFTLHPEQSEYLMYNVKSIVEEGAELFGYSLCFIASLCYYSEIKDNRQILPLNSQN
ncbi:hypothetical protein [Pragia fontium]|uniref:Uncharacterized protein n=2 Tax=Pragia fontium TaxID=82985 RepID=A0AAJ4W945_9GAMM|nr:hypothetical protein [Pragia fontium]GKX62110.1 hypothetical protein SOASR032_06790 [Pragia fontium]SFC38384.1 hypothetical protein SAMN02745723_102228 [Pragia fontium DSM 5563 = ATCC 49100]SUB82092.1 Uncharacterised protein [Pragia fontium]VEJ54728.1 Uncharacterised protein [Pragia fontium]